MPREKNPGGSTPGRRRTDPGSAHDELRRRFGLTDVEADVAETLLRGLSYEDAAQSLGMSPHTIHSHVKAIHRKAGVATSLELVARFYAPA